MTKEEQLADITADLVELEANHPFLARLFSLPAGMWEEVTILCDDLPQIKDQIKQLQKYSTDILQVTWLDYPYSTSGKGYCVIIFFAEVLHWNSVALYNKQWFLQKFVRQHGSVK